MMLGRQSFTSLSLRTQLWEITKAYLWAFFFAAIAIIFHHLHLLPAQEKFTDFLYGSLGGAIGLNFGAILEMSAQNEPMFTWKRLIFVNLIGMLAGVCMVGFNFGLTSGHLLTAFGAGIPMGAWAAIGMMIGRYYLGQACARLQEPAAQLLIRSKGLMAKKYSQLFTRKLSPEEGYLLELDEQLSYGTQSSASFHTSSPPSSTSVVSLDGHGTLYCDEINKEDIESIQLPLNGKLLTAYQFK